MYLLTGRPAVVRMTVSSVGEKMRLFAACAALNLDSTREGKDSESPSNIMLYEMLYKSLAVRTLEVRTVVIVIVGCNFRKLPVQSFSKY